MNIKLKAGLYTLGIVAGMGAAGVGFFALMSYSMALAVALVAAYVVWLVYDMSLSRLKSKEAIAEIEAKYQEVK